jgi:hypothetical protein
MAIKINKLLLSALLCFGFIYCHAQSFKISTTGDTLNYTDKKGRKQGKWVLRVEELRGNPGYEEEGLYIDSVKEGYWRRYNLEGDFIALERFKKGGKDGVQLYYDFLGNLEREESWRGYDPNAPYDTIAVYGQNSDQIVDYKIVKAAQYSVKHGDWKWYDPPSGRVVKVERYDRGMLEKDKAAATASAAAPDKKKKEVQKTAEMLNWEKKNKGKKKAVREGQTGL